MNGRVARDLRRLAHAKWSVLKPEYKEVVSVRQMYKQLKGEYKDDKR